MSNNNKNIVTLIEFKKNIDNIKFLEKYLTPIKVIEKFYKLLKIITTYFHNNNVEFFIMQSTLLGLIKYNTFIPWETDIDIGIFEKDIEHLRNKNFTNLLKTYRLFIKKMKDYQIYKICQRQKGRIQRCFYPNIDITIYNIDKNNNICLKKYCDNDIKPPIRYYMNKMKYNDLYPLIKKKFHDIIVYIPNNYKFILDTQYKNYENKIFLTGTYEKKKGVYKFISHYEYTYEKTKIINKKNKIAYNFFNKTSVDNVKKIINQLIKKIKQDKIKKVEKKKRKKSQKKLKKIEKNKKKLNKK